MNQLLLRSFLRNVIVCLGAVVPVQIVKTNHESQQHLNMTSTATCLFYLLGLLLLVITNCSSLSRMTKEESGRLYEHVIDIYACHRHLSLSSSSSHVIVIFTCHRNLHLSSTSLLVTNVHKSLFMQCAIAKSNDNSINENAITRLTKNDNWSKHQSVC